MNQPPLKTLLDQFIKDVSDILNSDDCDFLKIGRLQLLVSAYEEKEKSLKKDKTILDGTNIQRKIQ